MENGEKEKRSLVRTIVLVILVIAVAAAVVWKILPVSLFPKEYSNIKFSYIMIDGVRYQVEDGWPSEEQLAQLESVLKPLKMTRTFESEESISLNDIVLYIPFSFYNEKNVHFHTGSIMICSDMSARSRTLPFLDLFTHIDNGAKIYQDIMYILGTPPKK